jgi:hypothetical protein
MGKAKNDSDDDMAMDIEQPQPVKKKNKLIAKKKSFRCAQAIPFRAG